MKVRGDIGMLFQETALFDSLTVADNVGYRLLEEMGMPYEEVRRRSQEVLGFVGLAQYMDRMPRTSGNASSDDPTSGLDPITSKTIDNEIVKFRDLEHVTSIVVTHQLQDVSYIASHNAVARDGVVTIVQAEQGRQTRRSSSCWRTRKSISRAISPSFARPRI